MNNLVSETLDSYIKEDVINEVDPGIAQLATYLASGIGVVIAAGGLAYVQQKLKNSDNEKAQKVGKILAKIGKGAAEGVKKSPSLGESKVNEALDPGIIELAQYMGGALSTIIAAGGIAVLMQKLKQSKDPRAQKFGKILAKIGGGAAAGVKKSPVK